MARIMARLGKTDRIIMRIVIGNQIYDADRDRKWDYDTDREGKSDYDVGREGKWNYNTDRDGKSDYDTDRKRR